MFAFEPLDPPKNPHLSGEDGVYRAKATGFASALCPCAYTTDSEAIRAFVRQWRESPCTHRSYVREISRFLMWAYLVQDKPVSSMTRDDFLAFEEFLSAPPEIWCGRRVPRHLPDGRYNPEWRPFVGPLAHGSIRTAMRCIGSLVNFLVETGHIVGNPIGRRRRASSLHSGAPLQDMVPHALTPEDQKVIWEAITPRGVRTANPKEGITERFGGPIYERRRWALLLFYGTGLRISEVTRHRMGNFTQIKGKWRLNVRRKGGKNSWVAVSPEVLQGLKRYRRFLGLPSLPAPNDAIPLVPRIRDRAIPVSTRTLFDILKGSFLRAVDRIGHQDPDRAMRISQASPHWLRHTAISDLEARGTSLPVLQRFADHASPNTTAIYIHPQGNRLFKALRRHSWHGAA